MIDYILEPFSYNFMFKAILVSSLVGVICACISSFLIFKGWSLIGDALAHSIVPGVAIAHLISLPFSVGAFISGIFAAMSMTLINQFTKLREDVVIGLIYTSYLALGLSIVSFSSIPINIEAIVLGNILGISDIDILQIIIISIVLLLMIYVKWKDLRLVIFDESFAQSLGLNTFLLKILFITLLSAATVAALQTVGTCLVIALVITPGATAYLLTDNFKKLILISISMGASSCALGSYLSYFLDINPSGLIVCLQSLMFFSVLYLSPKHGIMRNMIYKKF